jgi:hypothetical protein
VAVLAGQLPSGLRKEASKAGTYFPARTFPRHAPPVSCQVLPLARTLLCTRRRVLSDGDARGGCLCHRARPSTAPSPDPQPRGLGVPGGRCRGVAQARTPYSHPDSTAQSLPDRPGTRAIAVCCTLLSLSPPPFSLCFPFEVTCQYEAYRPGHLLLLLLSTRRHRARLARARSTSFVQLVSRVPMPPLLRGDQRHTLTVSACTCVRLV